MATHEQISTITKHYLIALLWTMPGDDDNENPGDDIALKDLPQETINIARKSVETFVQACGSLFNQAMECFNDGYGKHAGRAEAAFGHDFALTRNRHGVGFWDRESEGLPRVLGDALTKVCEGFPEVNLYMGDNGKVYF